MADLPVAGLPTAVRGMAGQRLWLRSLAWLSFLGPFFFVSYGFANTWTSRLPHVGSIVFEWEHAAFPFVPMMILPYMSIDLFYGLSLFLVHSKKELDVLAKRLLLATVVSVTCFVIYPLQFKYARPPVDGFNAILFDVLAGFDKPFNQAPSLHISLLILLWAHYARHCRGGIKIVLYIWFALIGLSVLLTWQHHFIDVIGGLVVGFVVWYVLPEAAVALRWSREAVHFKKALPYACGGVVMALAAAAGGGLLWLFMWSAGACCIVAAGYLGFGPSVFQKGASGTRSMPATILLLPYLAVAHLFRRCFNHRHRSCQTGQIGGLLLYAWPGPPVVAVAVLDLCAEFDRSRAFTYYASVPMQDLVCPAGAELDAAMAALAALAKDRAVAVHCALGRGRSAVVAAAWLLQSRQACSASTAVHAVMQACPLARISIASERALARWWHAHR